MLTENLDALLEAVLARAGEPVSVAMALRTLPAGRKPTKAEVQVRLGKLAEAGRLHRWPGAAAKFSSFSCAKACLGGHVRE
jgi:hypothetical protein